jgi:hypothetical protein
MVGHLEFRVLANSLIDEQATDDAWEMLNNGVETDATLRAELKAMQDRGLPPPPPRLKGNKEQTIYEIKMPNGQKCQVTYSWVELGPHERRVLGFYAGGPQNPDAEKRWQEMKRKLGRAVRLKDAFSTTGRFLLNGALFYSRACSNRNLSHEERDKRVIDFFVLTRDPELDRSVPADQPLGKRRTARIDETYLKSVSPEPWDDFTFPNEWRLDFTLNATGTELFRLLTQKNAGPEPQKVVNYLAVLLDDQVLSAPTLNSEIRTGRGMIAGRFVEQEMKNLAIVLTSGALPARLKSLPVSETEVPGKKSN